MIVFVGASLAFDGVYIDVGVEDNVAVVCHDDRSACFDLSSSSRCDTFCGLSTK